MHNALKITEPLPTKVSNFHGRPFRIIGGEKIAQTICARITDPTVKRIARRRLIGSIDQFSDSTDLIEDSTRRSKLCSLYE